MCECELRQEIQELKLENSRLKRLLESLTPGGSEFHDEPLYCAEWATNMIRSVGHEVTRRKEAEAKAERLQAVVGAADELAHTVLHRLPAATPEDTVAAIRAADNYRELHDDELSVPAAERALYYR